MNTIQSIIPKDYSGSVLVKKDRKTLFKQAFGFRDIPNKIPNEIDTKFATASAGKFFVAVGIMKLIEKGALKLTDTIGSILDFDLHDIDPLITIEQLLTNTSGIPDYFDESVMDEYADLWVDYPCYKIRRSKDLLPLFITKPMMYSRGEKFQYNNTGFVVLDLVIEAVTSMKFDEYLNREVFIPCGMSNTGYYEMDRLPSNCANAYIWDEERNEFYTNMFSVDTKGTGAGGAFTTVNDISKFWDALLNGSLLSKKIVETMFSVHASEGEDYYGYGVWLKKTDTGITPFFQGCDPGVSFISSYDTDNAIEITITSNLCNNVWELEGKISEITSGEKAKDH